MDTFVAGAAGAVGGAIGGLMGFLLAQTMGWWNRPRLKIEISPDGRTFPEITSQIVRGEGWIELPDEYMNSLIMSLNVSNKGRALAMNCDARFRLHKVVDGVWKREPVGGQLHWLIRDPSVDGDNQFDPIHINPKAPAEELVVVMLPYSKRQSGNDVGTYPDDNALVYSKRSISLEPHVEFGIEVTVAANNSIAKPFRFIVSWDGTFDQFESGRFYKSAK